MTTPPTNDEPGDDRRVDDQPSDELHTCYNCFAEFKWTPTIHDGEEFCCSGCVEGGPCICSYDGPSPPGEVEQAPEPVVSEPDPEPTVFPDIREIPERVRAAGNGPPGEGGGLRVVDDERGDRAGWD